MKGPEPLAPARRPPGHGSAYSWRLFRSLRIHLAALLAALFLVFYVVTAVLIYGLTARLTQSNLDAILRDTTRPLAASVVDDLDRGIFPAQFVTLAHLAEMYPKVSAIGLRDAQGNVIASTAPLVTGTLPYQLAGGSQTLSDDDVAGHGWYRVLTVRLLSPYRQTLGYLQVAINIDRDRTSLHRLAEALVLVGGLGILLAALAGFFVSRLSLRPAVRAWQQQERFVADASHELRTPLAVMRVNLDLVNSRPESTVADNRAWLQAIEDETQRLHRLTDQLLSLARNDGARSARGMRPLDLGALAARSVAAFRAAAEAKGLEISFAPPAAAREGEDGLLALGDADSLAQLLGILLDNAIKYTATGRVDVAVERSRREVRLSVRDTGIGIAPQHRDRIFDRFYRADAARAKDSGGAGLGLAIAQAIVAAHRGRIAVESQVGQGSAFVVYLPAADRRA